MPKASNTLGKYLNPQYSKTKANQLSMSVASGFKQIIEEKIINQILPPSIFEDTLQRAKKRSETSLLGKE
jgi:hypothetical protein